MSQHPLPQENQEQMLQLRADVDRLQKHLDQIVEETSQAAHDIINKCEEILDAKTPGEAQLSGVRDAAARILEMCTFQDIVSQRCKIVSSALGNAVGCDDASNDRQDDEALKNGPALKNDGEQFSQDDIDKLLED